MSLKRSAAELLFLLAETEYQLGKLSGDTHYAVDVSPAASADCITIVELIDDIGTSGGQVGFIVKAPWRQLDVEI